MLASDRPIRKKAPPRKPFDGVSGSAKAGKGVSGEANVSRRQNPRPKVDAKTRRAAAKAMRSVELASEQFAGSEGKYKGRARRAEQRRDKLIAERLPQAIRLLGGDHFEQALKQATAQRETGRLPDGKEAFADAALWTVTDAGLLDKKVAAEQRSMNRNNLAAQWKPVDEKRREADRERERMDRKRDKALSADERKLAHERDERINDLRARSQAAQSMLGQTGIELGPKALAQVEQLRGLARVPGRIEAERRRAEKALAEIGPRYSKEAQAVYRLKHEAELSRRAGKKVDPVELRKLAQITAMQQRNLAAGKTSSGDDPGDWDERLKAAAGKGAKKVSRWPGQVTSDPLGTTINVLETASNAPGNLAMIAGGTAAGLATAALHPVATVKAVPDMPGAVVDEAEVALSDPGKYIKENPVVVIGGGFGALKATDNLLGTVRGNRRPDRKQDAPRLVEPGTMFGVQQFRPTGLVARAIDVRRKPGGKNDTRVESKPRKRRRVVDRAIDQRVESEKAELRIAQRDVIREVERELREKGLGRRQARHAARALPEALFTSKRNARELQLGVQARERLTELLGEQRVLDLIEDNKARLAEQNRRRAELFGFATPGGELRTFVGKQHPKSHAKLYGTEQGYETRIQRLVDDATKELDKAASKGDEAAQVVKDMLAEGDEAVTGSFRTFAERRIEDRGDPAYKSAHTGEWQEPKRVQIERRRKIDPEEVQRRIARVNDELDDRIGQGDVGAKIVRDMLDSDGKLAMALQRSIEDDLRGGSQNRYALLPPNVQQRFVDHAKVGTSPSPGAVVMRGLNAMANRIGLPLSPGTWAGSAVEPWLHVLAQGALSPSNIARSVGHRREMRGRHGKDWAATRVPGNYVGGVITDVGTQPIAKELLRSGAQIWRPDGSMTGFGGKVKAWDDALEWTGARTAGRMYNRWVPDLAFRIIGGSEHAANKLLQAKALGRVATGATWRPGDAKRMADLHDAPGNQELFRRSVQDMAGRYDALPPLARKGVRYYAPWMAWVVNTGTWPVRFIRQRPATAAALLGAGQMYLANNDELVEKYGGPDFRGTGDDRSVSFLLPSGRRTRVFEYANPAAIWAEAAKGTDNLGDVVRAQILPTLQQSGRIASMPSPKEGSGVSELEHGLAVASKAAGVSVPLWNLVMNKTYRVPERLRHRDLGEEYTPLGSALDAFPLTSLVRGSPPTSEELDQMLRAKRLGLEVWQVRRLDRLQGISNREVNRQRTEAARRRRENRSRYLTEDEARRLELITGREQ